jgi:drug/metabolite transporter (DMT)-like permease
MTGAPRQPGIADWVMLWSLVALWGSAFLLIAVALKGYSPLSISTGRLIIGAAVLMLIVVLTGRRIPREWASWGRFVLMALVGNALPFFLVSWGQQGIPSGLAGILMAVMPLVVLALAHFLVPGERMSPRRVLGFVAGFAGIVILLGPQTGSLSGTSGLAYPLAVLGAAVCYGLNVIIARRSPSMDPVVVSASVLLLAAMISAAAWLATGDPGRAHPGPAPRLALLALGAFCTGLATVLYYRIVNAAGATFLSLINYLIPVWAVGVGALFLGERLPPSAFAGLAMILGGIVISQSRPRREAGP